MGLVSNLISSSKTLSLFLLLFVLVPKTIQKEQGFVSVIVSNKGLDFAKDLIVQKAVSSLIPLKLPGIEKNVNVPIIGKVKVVVSNITVNSVDVPDSFVESGETGVVFVALNATAKLSLDWRYFYRFLFVEVSDFGTALVEVQGMSVGVTLAIEDQEGTLKLLVLDSGCYLRNLIIKLNGGASWLYQGLIDVFHDLIMTRVENSISMNIQEGTTQINTFLQTLPKQIPVYENAAMNATVISNPVLSNSSIEFDINGLFSASQDSNPGVYFHHAAPQDLVVVASNSSIKMVEISLHERVFYSVSSVFFNEGYLRWIVDKVSDESLLNTARWKYIIPKLYKKYPDEAMILNISISSPPTIKIFNSSDIDVMINSDIIVNVLNSGEDVPVIGLSLDISASCSPKMVGNKLVGTLQLRDFEIFLEWTKVGNLHMHLIQSVITVILKRFVFPYANVCLWKGLPLPILSGLSFQNSEIYSVDSKLVICSDVAFVEQWQSLQYV